MPNWTYNTISADKEWVALVKEKHTNEQGEFDFNTLIPMPKSLEITSGSMNDTDLYYYISEKNTKPLEEVRKSPYAKLINNVFSKDWLAEVQKRVANSIKENTPPDYDMGKQLVENFDAYGHLTWYTWCIDNWGTKWNACASYFNDDDFGFDTAWDSPLPILAKLAETYPKVPFHINSEFEDGYIEEFENRDGVLVQTAWYETEEDTPLS